MAPLDVCPTEDAVKAFLEYLVDPMLPLKASIRDNPTPSEQQSVAKQVHSVVLLYNYYHRKQHPELAFLAFDEFCKMAVVLRPALLAHMKFMQKPDESELVDVEKQLSLTEKKIMNACDICTCLDASKNVPNVGGWPISKVAVLLIDCKKENCFLLFSSITEGVWSLVEKDVDTFTQSSQSSDVTSGTKYTYKKKRGIKKPIKDESKVDEDGFLQVGYSVIKEAAGVNKADIMLLESYTVYSQSKEKTASRVYIMKCSQLINQEVNPIPIKDLIESLRGPLVKRSCSSWMVTPAVEYFHVLPYAEIISEWISRVSFSNSLQDLKLAEKNIIVNSPEVTESYVSSEGMSVGLDNKPGGDNIESLNLEENNECCTTTRSASIKEAQDMDVDNSSVFPSKAEEECQHIANALQVSEDQEIENPSVQHHSNGSTSPMKAEKVDSTRMLITEGIIKDQSACNKICANTSFEKDSIKECALIANNSNLELEKLQILLASKGKTLSQTALNALIQKRNALALQQRMIEDEIALCDKKIQRMLTGGEDDLELKIDTIIEGCNDTWVRNQGRMSHHLEDKRLSPYIKRKRLREAVLIVQNSCQELDGVCDENNWVLPTYRLSQSDGGFQANVTVKGLDFECSFGGNMCSCPREARESAAAQMLANLRSMAKSDQ
ncbi:uncharacterized protein LOC133310397 [Gastrolobium bilobum]|uniref:uncharacterized protein LOC133310397 n=1 Tax=Gastrolobium bilobum TaxID=150636 RepID=UPI002AB17B79|nr:uncharacterized protein LOC133310397 [Gastrolobium bilobum]XP_061367310.1 uncharacterized protein LOC133310397 [Gastrolobium bilobum]XP_061367311.1 uncharacterized protein LOC133310397 [Gastrolobium bilobum]XP_061367312.1 uncharacterized protein LOC133310397 [Gastrolobium bilobum]